MTATCGAAATACSAADIEAAETPSDVRDDDEDDDEDEDEDEEDVACEAEIEEEEVVVVVVATAAAASAGDAPRTDRMKRSVSA